MNKYPTRPKFFAQKFIRLMTKSAAAQTIGSEAMLLCCVVACQEDAKRYSDAVTYYNEQLMPLLGFGGRTRLVNARQRAVDGGWLHYEPGGKGSPGRYWVTVPGHLDCLSDGGCDEELPVPKQDGKRAGKKVSRPKTGRQPGANQDGKPAPYQPNPIPNPKTDASLFPEVAFEEFWKAYPARNGKKLEKAKAVKAFAKINSAEHTNVMQAVRNLTASGQHPKDAFRFLADSWREWVTAPSTGPSETHRTQIIKRAKPMEIPNGN
ncbi:hypothetical protein [Rosistilla oblonga]|uniref:hypothetical protein n=1 Tax=Rosistilla oblonga TaxID=2527990 RepID=UPI003A979F9B